MVLGEYVVKIKDITEGLYDTLTGIGQRAKQAKWTAGGKSKSAYLDQMRDKEMNVDLNKIAAVKAREAEIANTPEEGKVFVIKGPAGAEYFKSYQGKWYNKFGGPDDYSVTHPVTHIPDIQDLESKLHSGLGQVVTVKQAVPGSNRFTADPEIPPTRRVSRKRGQQ